MKGEDKIRIARMEAAFLQAKKARIALTKEEFADKLNYSRSHLYKMLNGEFEISDETLAKAENLVDKTTNVSHGTNETKARSLKKPSKKKTIPFFDAPATAGMSETDMSPIHAPAGTIDVGDLLHDSQAAIRIYGNSMMPNYPPGCVVGLVRCDSLFIEPGEVYVIETKTRRILKRLFYPGDKSNSDKFICISDNTMKFEGGARDGQLAYPAFEIPKKEIKGLFVVAGVIKRNSNSIVINR
jgi:phage repressor protein C with HTH and peptisase S24 domain